jgi:glycosyltransferase involved in cell wall biosynthesis
LVRLKGWNDAIEAVRDASDRLGKQIILDIAGDGPDLNSLTELAKRNPWIQVHGKLDTRGIRDLLARVDSLLVPSRWAEPFGKVGLEAASQGVPSIAYPVGGISEWLKDGETGLFAETESPDPSKLADKICEIYYSEGKWNRLRIGAWKHAIQFTLDNHLEHFFASMEKAIRDFHGK